MTISRVASGEHLPDSAFRSQAPANGRVLRSLAGRARARYEKATGFNPIAREPPATTRNPQNKLGHDHSGPPWGPCMLHPVAYYGGLWATSGMQGERIPTQVSEITASDPREVKAWMFWVPPFDALPAPLIAPRGRLFLYVLARTNTGTSTLTVTLSNHYTRNPSSPTEEQESFALTTTESALTSTNLFIDCVPGYNRADLVLEGSHATNEISIVAMALYVPVKLGHGL